MNTVDFMTMPTPVALPMLPGSSSVRTLSSSIGTWRERVHADVVVDAVLSGSTGDNRLGTSHNSIAAPAVLSDYAVTLGAATQATAAAAKAPQKAAAPPRGEPR